MPEAVPPRDAASVTAPSASESVGKEAVPVASDDSQAGKEMTNFRKVCEFHDCFGLPNKTTPQTDVFDKDPKCVKLRLDLIREELKAIIDSEGLGIKIKVLTY